MRISSPQLRALRPLASLPFLAACASSPPPPPAPVTPVASVTDSTPALAASGAPITPPVVAASTPSSGPRLRVVFGASSHPAVFQNAGALVLGMPIADARHAAPALFDHDPQRAPGLPDIALSGHADLYGHLASLTADIVCGTAVDDVTAIWGAPTQGYDAVAKAKLYFWFNPAAHVRGTLEVPDTAQQCRIVLDRYLPIAEVIGDANDHFAWEREPVIGMSDADLTRVYGDYLAGSTSPCKSQILVLPPVEYDRTFTRVHLYCSAGNKVGSYELNLRFALNPAMKDDIHDRLVKKFGVPVKAINRPTSEWMSFAPGKLNVALKSDLTVKDAVITVSKPRGSAP
jgi:hypothetical protein